MPGEAGECFRCIGSSTTAVAAAKRRARLLGKHPLTRNGVKDATADEAVISAWWAEHPTANVGIATGPGSGFFMVGPDGLSGIAALAELERTHAPLPPSPRVASGSGGKHYYFAWPSEGTVRNARNHQGLPIDIRGAGGYVVAPPSRNSKGEYSWEVAPEDVAPSPDWLLDWVRSRKPSCKKTQTPVLKLPTVSTNGKIILTVGAATESGDVRHRAIAYLAECPPAISGQGGHDQTFAVARAVVWGFNLGSAGGYDLLAAHYNPRCEPPWSEEELRHKCDDADREPFDKPRGYLLGDAPIAPSQTANASTEEDIDILPMPPPAPWPRLHADALHGLAGDIVRTIEPETESDPVAILGQMLVAFGSAIGRGPHFRVEGDKHFTNLFLCLVGESSRGRKGTSRGRVMQLMAFADENWCRSCVAGGLSSGEGLIWAVRDPIERREPVKEKGRITGYQDVVIDEGIADKRLLADESEFAMVLKVLQREGNSLSPVIRQSWDTGNLRTLTKNSPARATGAHVSLSGHITKPELVKYLKDTEAFNGFANRFLWLCVRRARLLPEGGRVLDQSDLGTRLNFALASARNVGEMRRNADAARLWREVYPTLTGERPSLHGAVTSRAEAQVLRLSMLYALLDSTEEIGLPHLRAALALWAYADESARVTFGAAPEDSLVGMVLAKITTMPNGLTRNELRDAFHRNVPSAQLLATLARLRDQGKIYAEEDRKTGGRPAERWRLRGNAVSHDEPDGDGKLTAFTAYESGRASFTSSPGSYRREEARGDAPQGEEGDNALPRSFLDAGEEVAV
jgi:hypothetical protein